MIYDQLYLIYMLLKDDFLLLLFIIQLRLSIVKWDRKCLLLQDPKQYLQKCTMFEKIMFIEKGDILI